MTYRMSCRPTEADHTLHFREVTAEQVEDTADHTDDRKTTVRGWKRSGERTDVSVGGGGSLD